MSRQQLLNAFCIGASLIGLAVDVPELSQSIKEWRTISLGDFDTTLRLVSAPVFGGVLGVAVWWTVPRLFERLPIGMKMRFGFYRELSIRRLLPEVQLGLEYLDDWQSNPDLNMTFYKRHALWRGQVRVITTRLNEIGMNVTAGRDEQWEWFLPQLEALSRAGTYESVAELCDDYRERLALEDS